MLRKTLLATTALVLCASLAYAGQTGVMPKNRAALAKMLSHAAIVHPGARGSRPVHNTPPNLANAIFSNYSKDANAQYISWYGFLALNSSYYHSYDCYASWGTVSAENALAFTPAISVTTKKVTVPVFSFYPSAQYEVDIHSSVGGLPGNVIATSKPFTASNTDLCCTASRTVPIRTNLIAGKQYFIGVIGVNGGLNHPAFAGWSMEDTDFTGAAVDYYRFKSHGTYNHCTSKGSQTYHASSPWHASTAYPATGAVVLK